MTRKYVKGDQPSGGETTWTNTRATRYGRGQHKTGSFGDDMLRPSPNHGTQRLPNDDDDDNYASEWLYCPTVQCYTMCSLGLCYCLHMCLKIKFNDNNNNDSRVISYAEFQI